MPSSPLMIVLSSLVLHPPVSGVPVAGATVHEVLARDIPKLEICTFRRRMGPTCNTECSVLLRMHGLL